MPGIYVFGTGSAALAVLTLLERSYSIGSTDVSAVVTPGPHGSRDGADLNGVPVASLDLLRDQLDDDDIIVVAGPDVDAQVAELFACGLCQVYDGVALRQHMTPTRRFLDAAADCYLGPNAPDTAESGRDEFLRYASASIEPQEIPGHRLFVVNSMPKAGSIWMIAMLEQLLGVKARERITLSHVRDIETDWPKRNCHGAVVLVRDMRDVVVSWFHHLQRQDLQNGFPAPRYPTLDEFYFDYFLGQIFGSDRYYSGDLNRWLDFVGSHSFPLIRYEDLLRNTAAALRKVMTFWKLDVPDETLRQLARDYAFDTMARTVSGREGYVAESVESGHLRTGQAGSWQEELPAPVAKDVNRQFGEYQRRLRYV